MKEKLNIIRNSWPKKVLKNESRSECKGSLTPREFGPWIFPHAFLHIAYIFFRDSGTENRNPTVV